jgi:arabinogalactan endo-1,4-beta-galactosidase
LAYPVRHSKLKVSFSVEKNLTKENRCRIDNFKSERNAKENNEINVVGAARTIQNFLKKIQGVPEMHGKILTTS